MKPLHRLSPETLNNLSNPVRILLTIALASKIPIFLVDENDPEAPPQAFKDKNNYGSFFAAMENKETGSKIEVIFVRDISRFATPEEFCRVLAHELTHAMGTEEEKYADNEDRHTLAKEEITAEFGAKYLLNFCQVISETNDRTHEEYTMRFIFDLSSPDQLVNTLKDAKARIHKLLVLAAKNTGYPGKIGEPTEQPAEQPAELVCQSVLD